VEALIVQFSAEAAARFWAKVQKLDGCWLWMGARKRAGYGNVRINKQYLLAHRVAWYLAYGAIPSGMCVCHHCDVPQCVRHDHLFLGTVRDNAHDMVRKRRHSHGQRAVDAVRASGRFERPWVPARGERSPHAKLSDENVRAIRQRVADGAVQKYLALEYGVSNQLISRVAARGAWSHVE
jgi:hypothetical protein